MRKERLERVDGWGMARGLTFLFQEVSVLSTFSPTEPIDEVQKYISQLNIEEEVKDVSAQPDKS